LIISPERWGKIKVSKHHYALTLAKRGNVVYYLNPPSISGPFSINVKNVRQNLKIINYRTFLRGSNRFPMVIRRYIHGYLANKIIKTIDKSIDITWSFDPSSFQYLDAFGAKLNIYHAVDVHKSRFEKAIVKYADIIFATSEKILERYNKTDKLKFKINHGLAENFLSFDKNIDGFIKNKNRLKVGYVGNLHYKYLDENTLKDIITRNPLVDFYFIGPYEESNINIRKNNENFVEFLKILPNVILIGVVASEDLNGYLKHFDTFLMCYSGDKNISEMANPHKILEFLSTGKVIVSHYIDEYKNYTDIICMSKNNNNLGKLFKKVVSNLDYYNNDIKKYNRLKFAKKNTYKRQLNKIEKIMTSIGLKFE